MAAPLPAVELALRSGKSSLLLMNAHQGTAHDAFVTKKFCCLHCKTTEARLRLEGCLDYYMGKPGTFDYYSCSNCKLFQIYPVPPNMSRFYGAYQVHAKKSWLHETMRRRLMSKGYYFPSASAGKLRALDYGCGDGWYLREMRKRGHDAIGFEANPAHAQELSRYLKTRVFADIDDLRATAANSLDLVTMHFVVEHLSDLQSAFELAHALLKPGGKYYFMVPNIQSREAKLFRRKWHGLDPPRHLLFPTVEIARELADKIGFAIQKIDYFSLPNGFAGSLSNLFAGRFVYPAFVAFMLPSLLLCILFRDGNLALLLEKKDTSSV